MDNHVPEERQSPGRDLMNRLRECLVAGEVSLTDRPSVPRRIVGFHQDDERHWVADLECGHAQHMRHEPPLVSRPWVLTEEGRAGYIGRELGCVRCAQIPTAVPDSPHEIRP